MLVKLFVQNYALIRELDVEFETGLTIITGETGAGKSILLGALSLILGSRADTNVLLDKREKCVVEGSFRIEVYQLEDFFVSNDLDYDPVTILRREISPAGKSRAFINDTPVTVNLLKELGSRLIDIHSQHQTLMLNDNNFQLNVIDSFAGTLKLKNGYSVAFNNFRRLRKEYAEVKELNDKNKADLEYYLFQLNQLAEAKLRQGEQEELEREQELLEHAEEIKSSLENSSYLLQSEEGSLLTKLREVRSNISRICSFLPGGEELVSRIESSYIELNDLAGDLARLSDGIEANPGRLEKINSRLDLIYSLIQKHRVNNLDELILRESEIRSHIRSTGSTDERLQELESLLATEEKSLRSVAEDMSSRRKAVLHDVEGRITDILRQLGMPNGRFRIVISQSPDLTATGTDHADFLFSANKQIEPEDLARIASGGELSRVMLSLKSLLTRNTNLPTIIFDEIDAGVSGEVADKVGQILALMGKYMQVVNITHLPQVASRGTKHYHVYKEEKGDETITRVKLLSAEERILEVARLLSGSEVTETAIRNATELLQAAVN
ncbi:MAG: DNA repair protein RecN [Bacteroidales bacterium]